MRPPSVYQPTPKPSALMRPCTWCRGAYDCTIRPCSGSSNTVARATGAPRYASCLHIVCAPEAGEDLAADRMVPVAERGARDRRVRGPRSAAQRLVLLTEEHLGVLAV